MGREDFDWDFDSDFDVEEEPMAEDLGGGENNGAGYMTGEEEPQFDGSVDTGGGADSPEVENQKKGFRKTGLFIIGIGLLGSIIAVILLNVVSSAKARKQAGQMNQTYVQETQAPKETQNPEDLLNATSKKNEKEQQAQAPQVQTQTVVKEVDPHGWVEVDLSGAGVDFGDRYLEGTFLITDIEVDARLTGANNDKQLRGILSGSISGLAGTYKLEVPADVATKLQIGQQFTVEYQLQDMGDYKLVGHIQY